jgi:hypothetical protein
MKLFFQNIYFFFKSFFNIMSFRSKPHGFEPFYDDDSNHTVEYEFRPINESENNIVRL